MSIPSVFRINFYLLFTALFFSFHLHGQNVNFITLNSSVDWENALIKADKEGKKVFLDIYAAWCGPCKMMDANVYKDSMVADYFNKNFINTKIDGESEFGMILARSYKLTAYPSMFFVNSRKETILTVIGYRDPVALSNIGRQVFEKGERYLTLNERYDSGKISPDEQKEYLDLLLGLNQEERYRQVISTTLNNFTDENIFDPANKQMILKGGGDLDARTVNVVINNASHFRNAWGIEDFSQYLSGVFNQSMQKAIIEKDEEKMVSITDFLIPVYLADSPQQIPSAKFTTRKIYYSQLKDWDKYIGTVEDFYLNSGQLAKKYFHNEVYYIIENQIYNEKMLLKALEWINREIEIQPDFESYFLGTVVNTYRKDFKQVDIWMTKAEPLAISEEDKNSIKELKNYIRELKTGSGNNE